MRAQLAKVERTNATLRTKNRELKRAANDAAERIAELEEQVSRYERRLARDDDAVDRRKHVQVVQNRNRERAPAKLRRLWAADHVRNVPGGVARLMRLD